MVIMKLVEINLILWWKLTWDSMYIVYGLRVKPDNFAQLQNEKLKKIKYSQTFS